MRDNSSNVTHVTPVTGVDKLLFFRLFCAAMALHSCFDFPVTPPPAERDEWRYIRYMRYMRYI